MNANHGRFVTLPILALTFLGVATYLGDVRAAQPQGKQETELEQLRKENERLREELRQAQIELRKARAEIADALVAARARQAQAEAERERAEALRQLAELEARRAEQGAVIAQREAAARRESANNLKQIGLAMHAFHDGLKSLPTPAIMGKNGKPLLSWRVAILPYLEEGNLYKQFKLDEPWDSTHNKKLLAQMPKVYTPVLNPPKEAHATYYRVFTGPGTVFEGTKGIGLRQITDGSSNTVMVVEANQGVPWTKPDELSYVAKKELPKLGGAMLTSGFNMLMCDGAVRFVSLKFDVETMRRVITRNDAQIVDLDKLDR